MVYHIVEIVLLAIVVILQIINLVKKSKRLEPVELEAQCCECTSDEKASDKSRYYVICVCTNMKNGQRVYRSFTTLDYIEQNLSAKDLETLRENVLTANPEYKDCVITFFSKIKG